MTTDLLILCKNEIEGLRWCAPRIAVWRHLLNEIIVADGHSTDGSTEFCREQGWTVLSDPAVGGVEGARQAAWRASKADAVIIFTPDGNSLPCAIPYIIEKLLYHEFVIASRYTPHSRSFDDDAVTRFGNWMFTRIVNLMFGGHFTDVLVGLRGYRRSAIERMHLNQIWDRWPLASCWELASVCRAKRYGIDYCDAPADEPKRIGGVRKMNPLINGAACFVQIARELICKP